MPLTSLPDRSPLPFDPTMPSSDRCRLLTASFPDSLRGVLAKGHVERRPRFRDDAFEGLAERWLPPATVSAREAAMAERVLGDMTATILAPAEPPHLLARILSLLSHYPGKAHSSEVEQMIALDWIDDLGEFPAWAIDAAARSWRRTRKWRPSIAEMRSLCEEACAQERDLAERLGAIARAGAKIGSASSGSASSGGVESLCRHRMRRMP